MPFVHVTLPGRVIHGSGAIERLADEVRALGQRAWLVTSPSIAASPLADLVTGALGTLASGTFAGGSLHVPMGAVMELAEVIRHSRPDVIVALGGGSALDVAKAGALAASVDRPFGELHRDHVGNVQCVGHREVAKVVTIPTTLTGAERTGAFSVVDGRRKLNYTESHVRPAVVIQDPDLLAYTPRRVLMESGMNSIAHSVEALLSGSLSPLLRPVYLEALQLHARHLPRARASNTDVEAHSALLAAGALASGVFGRDPEQHLGIIHALSHAVAGATGAAHGAVYGVVIEEGMRFNGEISPSGLRAIGEALGDPDDPLGAFVGLRAGLGLPGRLRELGVSQDDFGVIADAAMLHFGTAQNARPIRGASDVMSLLAHIH